MEQIVFLQWCQELDNGRRDQNYIDVSPSHVLVWTPATLMCVSDVQVLPAEVLSFMAIICHVQAFRVDHDTFHHTVALVSDKIEKDSLRRDAWSVPVRVAIALLRLGQGDSYRSLADRTGVGHTTC
jgi:hypothetical protein